MNELDRLDWKDLEAAWRAHDSELEMTETMLRMRLRSQKRLLMLHAVGEGASFLIAAGVWIWVALRSHAHVFGWMMLTALVLYEGFALWIRRSDPVSDTESVLDRLDLAIEQESRVMRSMQLGNAAAMMALGALVIATVVSVAPWQALGSFSSGMLIASGCFGAYVFGMHTLIIVHARRVRRRLERLETIRRALRAPG